MNTPSIPPLLGDGHGGYRVKITGNSGVGKTTLGKALAAILDVPYISLDALFFKPGWEETPTPEFREKVRQVLEKNPKGWVVDGDYTGKLRGVVQDESTDIIWLDPPLLLYFPRLLLRTFLRLLRLRAPCSPGCPEMFREVFFSRQSILWWSLSHHWAQKKRERARMKDCGVSLDKAGTVAGKMRRIGGWGGELKKWWSQVENMVHERENGSAT